MRLHAYCVDCGAVESTLPMRGRRMGYFERALGEMKADLENHPKYAKLAQVQSHLIRKTLAAVPDFGDPYSMPFETQRSLFLQAVQRVRPDLSTELIEETLLRRPREAQRHRLEEPEPTEDSIALRQASARSPDPFARRPCN